MSNIIHPAAAAAAAAMSFPRPIKPVQRPWFDLIARKLKTVEGRTGEAGKYGEYVGQVIQIECADSSAVVTAKVLSTHHYPDLRSYVIGEGFRKVAPQAKSLSEAIDLYLDIVTPDGAGVFCPERVDDRGGMVAVRLEVIGVSISFGGDEKND